MLENIFQDPRYEIFFKILFEWKSLFEIKNNTVCFYNGKNIIDFSKINYDCVEFPSIKTQGNITIKNLNCNKLIFNDLILRGLTIEDSDFAELEFKKYENTSITYFSYYSRCQETKTSTKIIPENINIKNIEIQGDKFKWDILNNSFLQKLSLNKVHLKSINNYNNLDHLILNRVKLSDYINISNIKKIKVLIYHELLDNTLDNNLFKNLKINDLLYLKDIEIDTIKNIKLTNLPNLEKIILHNIYIDNINKIIDLNEINSIKINYLSIIDYEYNINKYGMYLTQHTSCYSEIKIPISLYYNLKYFYCNDNNKSSCILNGKNIIIFKNSKNMIFFNKKKVDFINKYNIYEYISSGEHDLEIVKEFYKLRKSTSLMKKLLENKLDKINKNNINKIYQKDEIGMSAISYCHTINALKVILKSKKYTLDGSDVSKLSNKELKCYYQKELIKRNINREFGIKNKQLKLKYTSI